MVSRRKILSRSRDDLNLENPPVEEDENVYKDTESCFSRHIQEVFQKWTQIDDEIWAKVIVFERNRRVAKAFLRSPVLTINGSNIGFDGFRLGLTGFENPMRDPRTEEVITHQVLSGCKLRMDEKGSILVKRLSRSSVFVKRVDDDNCISNEVLRLPQYALELETPIKVFDIRKFEANIERELRKTYPDRAKLEAQCVLPLVFAKNAPDILSCPSWVMIINIVALDMLRNSMLTTRAPPNIRNRPRLPAPEEDHYSLSGPSSGSSSNGGSRPGKPPKLPPREGANSSSKGEYAYIEDSFLRPFRSKKNETKGSAPKNDDPYYCGLRARTTSYKGTDKERTDLIRGQYVHFPHHQYPPHHPLPTVPPHPAGMHHSRSYDSALCKQPFLQMKQGGKVNKFERAPMAFVPNHQPNYDSSDYGDSVYGPIYGRLPLPKRGYLPPPPHGRSRPMYGRPWE